MLNEHETTDICLVKHKMPGKGKWSRWFPYFK